MADGDLLLIFRSLDTNELQSRKQALLDQMTTITSRAIGSKSYTQDLRHLKDQLAAITYVLTERSNPSGNPTYVLTDFSGAGTRGQRPGTEEPL